MHSAKHVRRNTPLVSRLMGMETEYATIVVDPQNLDREDLPASRFVYEQICEAIRRDQPSVKGVFDEEQLFLASGGAVTFESHPSMHDSPGGLIEIATPEVNGPTDLLNCQRSIDQLVEEATRQAETSFDLRVLKNSSDAMGHVYGCQENYETVVASGGWLIVYRGLILVLWMLQIISLFISLPLLWLLLVFGIFFRKVRGTTTQDEQHEHDDEMPDAFIALPSHWASRFVSLLRLVHLPTVFVLRFVSQHVAFRPQRKYLLPFLVSRLSICASGHFDHEGRFRLSAKAMAIDSVADMGGFRGEKPVFVYGHWLSQFCAKSFLSLASTRQMFSRRQRLQIGLSDSNMSDYAEYVKVGSLSLLLDMIEAGETQDLLALRQPIDSIHRVATDWNLVSRVPTSRGEMSSLEIQRIYYQAAEQYCEKVPVQWSGESQKVLERWKCLIDAVSEFRRDATQTQPSLMRVDWLTKHWLIEQLGESAGWTAKKKIDLRYHELSHEGYFRDLVEARRDAILVDQETVRRRRRSPPAGSPAARRGWLIREFAGSSESIQSEWTYAIVGNGRTRKRVLFQGTPQFPDS